MTTYSIGDSKPVYRFNGSSNNVSVSHDSDFNITDAISLEVNFKPDVLESVIRCVLSKGTLFRFYNSWSNGSYPHIILNVNGNFPTVSTNTVMSISDLNHVMATYDSDSDRRTLRIYVDGDLDNESEKLTGYSDYYLDVNSTILYIGRYGSWFFDGVIDFVRIYNVELTPDEVKRNSRGNYTKRGLVSYWRFQEGTGSYVYDSVGGHTGTIG